MPLVKVKRHFQVTIPSNMCRMFGIGVGDLLEIVKQHNEIVLKPVKVVQPGQEYFYSKEWAAGRSQSRQRHCQRRCLWPF